MYEYNCSIRFSVYFVGPIVEMEEEEDPSLHAANKVQVFILFHLLSH